MSTESEKEIVVPKPGSMAVNDKTFTVEPMPVANQNGSASTLMKIIETIATRPELDDGALTRIERMYAMHTEMLEKQELQAYNTSMALAQGEIETVTRNREGEHSNFADHAALHRQAKPVWTKHGFSVSSKTGKGETDGFIRISCTVSHSGGHREVFENDWPLDNVGTKGATNKTPIHAMGSTQSYARRYTELMIFDISTGDDDDGQAMEAVDAETSAWIKNELQSLQVNVKAFCTFIKVKDVDSITEKQLPMAKEFLVKKRKERGNN